MHAETRKENADGWERVVPDTQRTLFPMSLPDALRELRITFEDIEHWRTRGWLSPGVAHSASVDLPEWNELSLVRDMDRSGLGHPTVSHLLSLLPRPLAMCPDRLAFSFAVGWVMRPEPRPPILEDINAGLVLEWVDSLNEEEASELWDVLDRVTARLKAISTSRDH